MTKYCRMASTGNIGSDIGSFVPATEEELAAIERIKTRFYQAVEQQSDKTISRSITEKESSTLPSYVSIVDKSAMKITLSKI